MVTRIISVYMLWGTIRNWIAGKTMLYQLLYQLFLSEANAEAESKLGHVCSWNGVVFQHSSHFAAQLNRAEKGLQKAVSLGQSVTRRRFGRTIHRLQTTYSNQVIKSGGPFYL
jgi:hypothetical protein